MTVIDGVFSLGSICYKQTQNAFQSSRLTGVTLCTFTRRHRGER